MSETGRRRVPPSPGACEAFWFPASNPRKSRSGLRYRSTTTRRASLAFSVRSITKWTPGAGASPRAQDEGARRDPLAPGPVRVERGASAHDDRPAKDGAPALAQTREKHAGFRRGWGDPDGVD